MFVFGSVSCTSLMQSISRRSPMSVTSRCEVGVSVSSRRRRRSVGESCAPRGLLKSRKGRTRPPSSRGALSESDTKRFVIGDVRYGRVDVIGDRAGWPGAAAVSSRQRRRRSPHTSVSKYRPYNNAPRSSVTGFFTAAVAAAPGPRRRDRCQCGIGLYRLVACMRAWLALALFIASDPTQLNWTVTVEWLRERTEYVPQLYETEKITCKANDAAENLQLYLVVRFFHPKSS